MNIMLLRLAAPAEGLRVGRWSGLVAALGRVVDAHLLEKLPQVRRRLHRHVADLRGRVQPRLLEEPLEACQRRVPQ